jgi:hypothetical protein
VLASASGRQLVGQDLAAVLRCFVLDSSAAIGWTEFEQSWRLLQRINPSQSAVSRAGTQRKGKRAGKGTSEGVAALASKASTRGWVHAAQQTWPQLQLSCPVRPAAPDHPARDWMAPHGGTHAAVRLPLDAGHRRHAWRRGLLPGDLLWHAPVLTPCCPSLPQTALRLQPMYDWVLPCASAAPLLHLLRSVLCAGA